MCLFMTVEEYFCSYLTSLFVCHVRINDCWENEMYDWRKVYTKHRECRSVISRTKGTRTHAQNGCHISTSSTPCERKAEEELGIFMRGEFETMLKVRKRRKYQVPL
jgi:hypothetical protein